MGPKVKLKTKDGLIEIEANRLPPGVAGCRTPDGERFYLPPELVRDRTEPVHPPLTGERLARLKRVYAILKDVDPVGDGDFEACHQSFRCNECGENDLALYERIARVYQGLVTAATSRKRRDDIYQVLLRVTVADSVETLRASLGPLYHRVGLSKITQIAVAWCDESKTCEEKTCEEKTCEEKTCEEKTYEVKIGHVRLCRSALT